MKQLSMTLVFDLSKYDSEESINRRYSRHDDKYGFVNFRMNFGHAASLPESSIRSRLKVDGREAIKKTGIRIFNPRSIICFNYRTLKHEFYKPSNFNDYIEPDNFRFPVNFQGSPISDLLQY